MSSNVDMSESGAIGRRIRAARVRRGWTREALAFHSGVSWAAISQVESGRRRSPRPGTLAALSHALGVSIDYLVDGSLARPTMLDHSVFAYRTDDQFQTTMGSFLAEGIERSEAIVVATTTTNIELLRERLGKEAHQVEFLVSKDFCSTPVAVLESVKAFSDAQISRGAPWVRFLGEPVWEGRSEADVRLWTRFESLFNLVFAASPLTVVCPYDERSVASAIVAEAHLTHPHAMGDREISKSPDYTDPERFALSGA